jgi:A/G-specific adenine glycosylase
MRLWPDASHASRVKRHAWIDCGPRRSIAGPLTIVIVNSEPERREFRRRLLAWFDEHKRDLPWRRTNDAYAIWVSEIMLQQTRVAAVLDHYDLFMRRYPTVEALAAAPEDDVLAIWSGLGYYRRARMLHKAAKFVVSDLAGVLPRSAAGLRALPGIGEYTSAAIASIAFGEAAAAIDGNVERVLMRLLGWDETTAPVSRMREAAANALAQDRPGDYNQAMMELGATVCLPRGPLCLQCPVQKQCATRGEHVTAERPKMQNRDAAYVFIQRMVKHGRVTNRGSAEVLLVQRAKNASLMAGMWELPSIGLDKTSEERKLLDVRHSITVTNYRVSVYGYEPGEVDLLRGDEERRWVPVAGLNGIPLTGLARKVLKRLKVLSGHARHQGAPRLVEVIPELV